MTRDMDVFRIRLAGIPMELRCRFPLTRELCAGYLTEEAPLASVEVTEQDVAYERVKSLQEAAYEGLPLPDFPDDYLESVAAYRKIAIEMTAYRAAVFHGAVVAVDGEAYAFTAASGTGKTTHMKLWLRHFGDRALVVNGDKPVLRIDGERVYACGTPWSGKENLNTNVMLPLKAICILERDSTNHIERICMSDALTVLMQQIYRPEDAGALRRTLQIVRELGERVKLYRLGCNMEEEAAVIAYAGMNQ
ncbi:MAG: hypothetical protein IKT99_05455 [Oscillospiraceae bacterium]|nr:hypothetical protein [Oscillospiraceae bacterium]